VGNKCDLTTKKVVDYTTAKVRAFNQDHEDTGLSDGAEVMPVSN
jgi:hypothetical protein